MKEGKHFSMPEFTQYLLDTLELNVPNLAAKLGLHKTTVYAWQKGHTSGVPLVRLEALRPKLKELGINIGKVTNQTVEILPEKSETSEDLTHSVGDLGEQFGKILRYGMNEEFIGIPGFEQRGLCTCGQEDYIRSVELAVIHLVQENMALKAQLFDIRDQKIKRG